MLYKISERDENAYSEQVQNSKSKNICAFYFDILRFWNYFGVLALLVKIVGSKISMHYLDSPKIQAEDNLTMKNQIGTHHEPLMFLTTQIDLYWSPRFGGQSSWLKWIFWAILDLLVVKQSLVNITIKQIFKLFFYSKYDPIRSMRLNASVVTDYGASSLHVSFKSNFIDQIVDKWIKKTRRCRKSRWYLSFKVFYTYKLW